MAKRKKTTKTSTRTVVVRQPSAAKPIIIRQSSSPVKRRGRRRSGGGGGALRAAGTGFMNNERIAAMVGAFLLGTLDKNGTALPTIPVLGRAGTLGVGLYYLGKHVLKTPAVTHASTGFLSIAAYEMGRDGKIAGTDAAVVGVDTI